MAATDRNEEQTTDPASPGAAPTPDQPDTPATLVSPPPADADAVGENGHAPHPAVADARLLGNEPEGGNGHESASPVADAWPNGGAPAGENGHATLPEDRHPAPLPTRRVRRVLVVAPTPAEAAPSLEPITPDTPA